MTENAASTSSSVNGAMSDIDPTFAQYIQGVTEAKAAKKLQSQVREDVIQRMKNNNPSEVVLANGSKLVYVQSKTKPTWNEDLITQLLMKSDPAKFASVDEANAVAKKMVTARDQMVELKDSCAVRGGKKRSKKSDGDSNEEESDRPKKRGRRANKPTASQDTVGSDAPAVMQ
jgi:hypothetical protein